MYWIIAMILAAGLLTAPAANAEHENDHRYHVRGYVLDENETPLAGTPVSIWLADQMIGTDSTDSDGYYRIRMHLHDPDLGRTLKIRSAAGEAAVQVDFEPGDKVTIRRHYANFIGSELIEEPLFWREFAIWIYAAVIGVVVIAAAVLFRGSLKRLLKKPSKAPPSTVQRAATKKRKKPRKRRTA